MTTRIPLHRAKALRTLGALFGLSTALGACIPHTTEVTTSSIDYRHRHPIAVTEADRSIVVFVGHARGGLSGSQRTARPMSEAIWCICTSPMPCVVTDGVPTRIPEATMGFCGSYGMAFLLSVMPARSHRCSAMICRRPCRNFSRWFRRWIACPLRNASPAAIG